MVSSMESLVSIFVVCIRVDEEFLEEYDLVWISGAV